MLRHTTNVVKGYRTQDGAGVSLVRVLGDQTARDFDPFLMLDSFDSTNPDDYTAGFPFHPHRGIETVSYLREGAMHHRDTMGFEDTVTSGEVQWMCAGSGVEHEETIPASRRLLGVQLWLNLPAADKMAQPTYHAVKRDAIAAFAAAGSVLAFTLEGSALIGGLPLGEKTAAKLVDGDRVSITATGEKPSVVLLMSSMALHEPIAWGGPIVMNTTAELRQAFRDLNEGTFIKKRVRDL